MASSIMRSHIGAPARRHINFRIVDPNKGQSNLSISVEMASNKVVNSFPVLESLQQGRKTIGLVVQGKHHLVNHRQS
jgi:hypothetical protein